MLAERGHYKTTMVDTLIIINISILGGLMVRTLYSRLSVVGSVLMTLPGYFCDRILSVISGKLYSDITTTQANSALHPSIPPESLN